MKKLLPLAQRSVRGLVRTAAVLALLALGIMCLSIVWPRPIVVVMAMSLGHVVGAAAVGCYALAILLTMRRTPPPPAANAPSLPPPGGEAATQALPDDAPVAQ